MSPCQLGTVSYSKLTGLSRLSRSFQFYERITEICVKTAVAGVDLQRLTLDGDRVIEPTLLLQQHPYIQVCFHEVRINLRGFLKRVER